MKNVLIIYDESINAPLDIFVATDKEFEKLFINGTSRVSLRDLQERLDCFEINEVINKLSERRVSKKDVNGINGVLYKTYADKVDSPYFKSYITAYITANYSGYKYILYYEYEPEIFAVTHEEFNTIFKPNTDIAFTHELELLDMLDDEELKRYSQEEILKSQELRNAMDNMLSRPVTLNNFVGGISGALFHRNEGKAVYYPTYKDEEAVNPNGTRLRAFGACNGQKQAIVTYEISQTTIGNDFENMLNTNVDLFTPELLLVYP
jgi:hypothetical protein